MKDQKKKRSSKQKKDRSNESSKLYDIGLEPPKIYREESRSRVERQNLNSPFNRAKKEELTRAQKRNLDNKKRKKRKKLRRVLGWSFGILVALAVAVVLSLTVFFKIDTITVTGNSRYTKDEIISHCSVNIGENLFLSDTSSAEQTLEQNLPYIYKAELKRKLPYTIEIKITEAQPTYSIKYDKAYILLDQDFKVLETNASKPQGLNISKASVKSAVAGKTIQFKNSETGECIKKLASAVHDNSFKEITSVYSNSVRDNYVVYENRIQFKLGDCENLKTKIYQGLAACEELNQSNPNATGVMTISGDKSLYFTEN